MISVGDTGSGMDAATMEHLFEPFFTTKELGRGTGLGLSTVYGIVKQSGGYILIDSAPGEGSTFKMYFPRVEEAPQPPARAYAFAGSLRGSETLLLAEDDERVRNLIKRILDRQGYTVLLATSCEEAVRLSRAHAGAIDLLVTDVVMPRMSGRDLAQEMFKSRPGLKVLYLSGYTDNVIARRGILEPGVRFLQKPFTPEVLARKVRDILDEA
jgi:CheY-like chemotaxis protein